MAGSVAWAGPAEQPTRPSPVQAPLGRQTLQRMHLFEPLCIPRKTFSDAQLPLAGSSSSWHILLD